MLKQALPLSLPRADGHFGVKKSYVQPSIGANLMPQIQHIPLNFTELIARLY
jgi:hypothetical protein